MISNVVHLPRPPEERPAIRPLGLYFRIGRSQHKDMLALLAEGERKFFGLVIDAPYAARHRELRATYCHDALTARLARQHNDANVLMLGARLIGVDAAKGCLDVFLNMEFE